MKGVKRLRKESVDPGQARHASARKLRKQIQERARHSASFLGDDDAPASRESHPGQSNAEEDNTLFFLRQGVQKKVLRDLKKGSRYPIGLTLDLHGLTQTRAQRAIDDAVDRAFASGIRCLLIIHGKGLHSPQGARLKRLTADYLRSLPAVRAYCSAQPSDGGTGAVYALARG